MKQNNMWTQVRTFGGVSGNKITAIAGESSTGKTFFSLAVVKNFLDANPDGYCLYFDTEAAVNKSLSIPQSAIFSPLGLKTE
jgi:RecA/RadA recombinase